VSASGPTPSIQRRLTAVLVGTLVAGIVVMLAAIGYEHIIDNLGVYEWQRLDEPSRRTVPFLVGLAGVCTLASFSGIWVAGSIWKAGRSRPPTHRGSGPP
jgi:formate/nitrite transporter FocA (FNT family)